MMAMSKVDLPQDPHSLRKLATWLLDLADGAKSLNTMDQACIAPNNANSLGLNPIFPDSVLLRKILRNRAERVKYFPADLFGEPAWEILLDLTAARVENKRVSVTSLCLASGVPPTTALRWIGMMVTRDILVREEDEADRRRSFVALSDSGIDAVTSYFSKTGLGGHL